MNMWGIAAVTLIFISAPLAAAPADLAKTERSMAAYRERAKELMVKADRMVAVDTELPKDVLDREEVLFSNLMRGEINMDAVVRGVSKCNRDYGFQDIS